MADPDRRGLVEFHSVFCLRDLHHHTEGCYIPPCVGVLVAVWRKYKQAVPIKQKLALHNLPLKGNVPGEGTQRQQDL